MIDLEKAEFLALDLLQVVRTRTCVRRERLRHLRRWMAALSRPGGHVLLARDLGLDTQSRKVWHDALDWAYVLTELGA